MFTVHDSVLSISFPSLVHKTHRLLGVMVNNMQEKTHDRYGVFT